MLSETQSASSSVLDGKIGFGSILAPGFKEGEKSSGSTFRQPAP